MPRKNQVPGFCAPERDGGNYHWKPSPRLRRGGWRNLCLGADRAAALRQAIARNEEVEAWERGNAAVARPVPPQRTRFRDLVRLYKASDRFTDLRPKSQAEYASRLRSLERWTAIDGVEGDLPVRAIDRAMVMELRDALVADGRKARTAAILRVLSIVMKFAADKMLIAVNPAREMSIPEPAKRRRRLLRDELAPLLESADALGYRHIALGVVLGFYTMQREADLLATTAFRLKALIDVSAGARRALAGPDAKVLGIELQQEKTDEWVGIPLVPVARAAVEGAIAAQRAGHGVAATHLILHPDRDAACPEWKFQRTFRETVVHAVARLRAAARAAMEHQQHEAAAKLDALADRLDGIQFRDLRRSGMCWMRELGVPVPLIAAVSGHSIQETQKILDTYMPRDTRAAAEGMAMAVTRQAERDAADEQEGRG